MRTAIVACAIVMSLSIPVLPFLCAPEASAARTVTAFPDGSSEKYFDFTLLSGGSATLPFTTLRTNETVTGASFRVSGEALNTPAQEVTIKCNRDAAAYCANLTYHEELPGQDNGRWEAVTLAAQSRLEMEDLSYCSNFAEDGPAFQMYVFNADVDPSRVASIEVGWAGYGETYEYGNGNTYTAETYIWDWLTSQWSFLSRAYSFYDGNLHLQKTVVGNKLEYISAQGTIAVCAGSGASSAPHNLKADYTWVTLTTEEYSSYPRDVWLHLFSPETPKNTGDIFLPGTLSSHVDIGTDGSLRAALNSIGANATSSSLPVAVSCSLSSKSPGRVHLTYDRVNIDTLEARLNVSAQEVETGSRVVFLGNDSSEHIMSFFFDYGDGTDSGYVASTYTAHSYNHSGNYTSRLKVKHASGEESRWSAGADIVVRNRPPVASAVYRAQNTTVFRYIWFDSTGSTDYDGNITSYLWEFGDGSTSSEPSVYHMYETAGTFFVKFTVTDDCNDSATAVLRTPITGIVPIVDFSVTPRFGDIRTDFSFISNAWDIDGVIGNWLWQFGDGATATSTNATHRYASSGTYIVTLTCVDTQGTSAYRDGIIVVGNAPPKSMSFASRARTFTGETMGFQSNGSADPDGKIVKYLWEFGDGTISSSENPNHIFSRGGVYTVTLTVTDDRGATASSTLTIIAENRAPSAKSDALYLKDSSEAVILDGSGSADPDGNITEYRWNLGDGTNATGKIVAHRYAAGTYTATLVVVDDTGMSSISSVNLIVPRPPPAPSGLSPLLMLSAIPLALLAGLWLGRKWNKKSPPVST